jgi:hypothetical protein
MAIAAPKPPGGTGISLDSKGNIQAGAWKSRAAGASVQTVDGTGKRVTMTRLALVGPFAFAAKKKNGQVSVVLCGADGSSATVKVGAKKAQDVMAWAIAFNAWSTAQG